MPIDHLPRRWRPAAERVRAFALTDATVLLILGAGCLARGISYSGLTSTATHPAEAWMSMGTWSSVWIALGVLCIGVAPWHRSATAALAVAAGVSLHMLWGFSFLWATMDGTMPRGWVSSLGYFMVTSLVAWSVWRGSRTEIRIREEVTHDRRDDHHGHH